MFSIIIPLYNKASYIQRAIDSILNQTFEDYEIIVINDGSTDGGDEIVEGYGDKVRLITQKNQGVSVARNIGIAEAKFDYIAFLDADDYWHPQYLEAMASAVARYPEVGLFGTSYAYHQNELVNNQSGFQLVDNYFKKAIHNTLFFTSATVVKKIFFTQNQGFKAHLKRAEDMDVWFRAILFFGDPMYCPDKLVFYEKGDMGSATNNNFSIKHALISEILNPDYTEGLSTANTPAKNEFDLFKEKYTLFNLYPYILDHSNHSKIQSILSQMGEVNFWASIFYKVPLPILGRGFSNPFIRNQFRNYLKFCFRYLHKG